MSASDLTTDVCIIGGGSVGALLALSLAHASELHIDLLEQQSQASLFCDPRHIALAASTVDTLDKLGIDCRTFGYPIQQIHVSDTGYMGQCRLHAAEVGVTALGYVVSLAQLTQCLHEQLTQCERVKVHVETPICGYDYTDSAHHLLSSQHSWHAQYCIVASGNSQTMPWLVQSKQQKNYGQFGVVANVEVAGNGYARYRHTTAFERFTQTGPLAMLPIADDRYSMLWSLDQNQAESFVKASHKEQLEAIQDAFGTRLGRFLAIDKPVIFPLVRTQQEAIHSDVIVLGNAAQALHPIAGQGFNLAHRDVVELVKLLSQSHPSTGLAEEFVKLRKSDRTTTTLATEWLVHSFSHDLLPFVIPRNWGLLGLQQSRFLRTQFARLAMGYR